MKGKVATWFTGIQLEITIPRRTASKFHSFRDEPKFDVRECLTPKQSLYILLFTSSTLTWILIFGISPAQPQASRTTRKGQFGQVLSPIC
jgi:hypothetical protein